jgi:hypothetical protein
MASGAADSPHKNFFVDAVEGRMTDVEVAMPAGETDSMVDSPERFAIAAQYQITEQATAAMGQPPHSVGHTLLLLY